VQLQQIPTAVTVATALLHLFLAHPQRMRVAVAAQPNLEQRDQAALVAEAMVGLATELGRELMEQSTPEAAVAVVTILTEAPAVQVS